jgi:hypothetical protein
MASHTDSVDRIKLPQDADVRRLNDLALTAGASSPELVRLWKVLSVTLEPYELMGKLSKAAQRSMLTALATTERYRTYFSRLEDAPWRLTLDMLVATFGCSSLSDLTMLQNLSDLAPCIPETLSWNEVLDALSMAQKERHGGVCQTERDPSVYKIWMPADVAAAHLVLMPPALGKPTPVSRSPPASDEQSGTEAPVASAGPSDAGLTLHTTARKRYRTRASVSAIELARSATTALDEVEDQTPTNKRSRRLHTLSTLPSPANSRANSIILQRRRIGAAVLPEDNMEAHELLVDTPTAANQDGDDNANPKEPSSQRQDADGVSQDRTAVDGGAAHEKSALGKAHALVAAQARHLMRNDESGWLSHSDFTTIINRILPPQFRCFELPDFDKTTDWAAWAKRPLNRALDRERAYISALHFGQEHHWVVLVTVPTDRVIDVYDSKGQTPELVARAAPHVVTRMGFNWEDGWRYRMRSVTKEDDAFSSGIHVLVCVLYRIAGETRPTTIDVSLWRHILSGLLVDLDAPFDVSGHLEGLVSAMVASPSQCNDTKRALAAHAWLQDHVQSMNIVFSCLEKFLKQEHNDLEKAFEQATAAVRDLEHVTPTMLALAKKANQGASLHQAHVPYMQELKCKNRQKKRYARERTKLVAKVERVSYVVTMLAVMDIKACGIMWNSIQAAKDTANDTLRTLREMESDIEKTPPSVRPADSTKQSHTTQRKVDMENSM